MSQLGSNARQRGRRDDALRWFEQAHGASRGPATRLQWGAAYLAALVELAPHDADRIERAAQRIVQDAAGDPAAFHERSGRSLQRVARALASWQGEGREPVLARLRPQLEPLCAAQPPGSTERAGCERLVKAAAG
jgi:hypothetical protein